jgi:hypothetical protein
MKTTWAKRELMRSKDFRASVHELRMSIEARYADELTNAGFFRRLILRYRIGREFNWEMTKTVEADIQPKKSPQDICIGLMCSSGILLLPAGLPVGIVIGLNLYRRNIGK